MLTHINSPVSIYHVLVCQPLSPPLITSISPPPPAPPTEPPRRFGLTVTVIGREAGLERREDAGGGGKDGGRE